MTSESDVLIVGAGLAGLACALRLQQQGKRVTILEARDMVGGRASRGGADFVHGQHVSTWRYIKRFGMEADDSMNGWAEPPSRPGQGECWVYVNGQLLGPDRVHAEPNRLFFGKLEELTEAWCQAGKEDISMRELAKDAFDEPPTDDEVRLLEGSMAEWHGADLEDVGVYEDDLVSPRILALAEKRPELLSEDGDEGHWRLLGGHQGLCDRMAKDLDVRLRTTVCGVQWAGGEVHVDCDGERGAAVHTARSVVVTVPLACLPDVAFEPQLPDWKKEAVQRLGRGVTTTMYLRFKERFWPEGMSLLFHPMSSQCFWPGRAPNVLTCYFGGKTANAELLSLSDEDRSDEVLRQLGIIFGKPLSKLKELHRGTQCWRWDTDPYAKMSYSYCPVGTAHLREALGRPCGNLFFAGEATHPTKGSYAHGALEEGERAADEVLQAMGLRSAL